MKAGDIYEVQEDGNLKKLSAAEIEERRLKAMVVHNHYDKPCFLPHSPFAGCNRRHVEESPWWQRIGQGPVLTYYSTDAVGTTGNKVTISAAAQKDVAAKWAT
jgi:hypothetical protein